MVFRGLRLPWSTASPLGVRVRVKLPFTIFNPANEKDAFAVGFSTTHYEPADAVE